MKISVRDFPTPVRRDDIDDGVLFFARMGLHDYLLMGVTTADGQFVDFLALDGPEPEPGGVPYPRWIGSDAVPAVVGALPEMELTVEPMDGGDYIGAPMAAGDYGQGTLLLDGHGRPWVCYVWMATRQFIDLTTGQLGTPSKPQLTFANWDLCLRDGKRRIVLARLGA